MARVSSARTVASPPPEERNAAMPEPQSARPPRSLLSRFGRIAGAAAIVGAVVVTSSSPAWAGGKHGHNSHSSRSSSSTFSWANYHPTGNPNYGWVIPITFTYAPGYGPG